MATRPTTRDRIIVTAMRLFLAKGYGATSIADILAETGINSGSLYHAFPGKQDLLLAVLEAYRTGIGPMLIAPAWDGVDDPLERIFALLGAYRRALETTDCTYGCPIGSLALELHEPDPPVRAALAANFTAWADAVETCLIAAGFADPRPIAEFVLVTMEGGVMLARTHRDIGLFDRAVAQLRAYFACMRGD
jgi:TetR/AcrR family transcriptional regulator, transcriptional repressor for nem operon